MALTFAVLVAVPASGLLRVDLVGGAHRALGRPTDGATAVVSLAVAAAAFYVVTFALNLVLGRVFCGWGCPVGEAARLAGEAGAPWSVAYALAFAGALVGWLVAPRSLAAAPAGTVAAVAAAWLAGAALVWLHGRFWGWSFCRRACPIGLYYSTVQTARAFGVQLDRARCVDCDACARACPVALDPRDLAKPIHGIGGLALDGMPGSHHCLTCGDCVRACERVLEKRAPGPPALRLGRPGKGCAPVR